MFRLRLQSRRFHQQQHHHLATGGSGRRPSSRRLRRQCGHGSRGDGGRCVLSVERFAEFGCIRLFMGSHLGYTLQHGQFRHLRRIIHTYKHLSATGRRCMCVCAHTHTHTHTHTRLILPSPNKLCSIRPTCSRKLWGLGGKTLD